MRHVASKFVPRLLSVDQKQQRLDVCLDLKENAANDPSFLSNVITGDETWVYAYDPKTKTQSSQWKSPGSHRPKKARQVRSNMTDNNMTVVPHPPYSPDLAPSDFFLFPKLKMKLNGLRFQTLEEIHTESQAVLNTLRENDFQECFKNWQYRWDRCQASEGDYFEGDAGP